jgi:hypothetical protein
MSAVSVPLEMSEKGRAHEHVVRDDDRVRHLVDDDVLQPLAQDLLHDAVESGGAGRAGRR